MQCEKCGRELEQDQLVCPQCGENPEAEVEETEQMQELILEEESSEELAEQEEQEDQEEYVSQKDQTLKAILSAVLAAALFLTLAFVVISGSEGGFEALFPTKVTEATVPTGTIPQDGNPDDETCKGSYTMSDYELVDISDTVVAQLGDVKLTNGQLQIYYWTQVYNGYQNGTGDTAPNFGMALDQQLYDKESGTSWQQYFLSRAVKEWLIHAVLIQKATEAEYVLPEDMQKSLDNLRQDFTDAYLKDDAFKNLDEVIRSDMGAGCSFADYEAYMHNRYYASSYYEVMAGDIDFTMADMEAFFTAHEEALKKEGITKDAEKLIDVRHILIVPENSKEDLGSEVVYDEEDWEACRQKAQALYDQWLADGADQDAFAELAKEHSEDTGSSANGGLYRYVRKDDMVEEFDAWCFDESRKEGDNGLVKTQYGYHIMYYVCGDLTWIRYAQIETPLWLLDQQIEEIIEESNVDIRYENMGLWYWIVSR